MPALSDYPDYSQYTAPFISPSSYTDQSFLPYSNPTGSGLPTKGGPVTTGGGKNTGSDRGFLGGLTPFVPGMQNMSDIFSGNANIWDFLDPSGFISGLFGGGKDDQKSYYQPYAKNGQWYSNQADPNNPDPFYRSPQNPVPITSVPGANQTPTNEYLKLANNVRSIQDLLPYLTKATNQADLQKALGNLNIANITSPGYAALQTQLYNTYGSQLNAIGNEINRRNALSQAQTENQVLTGPGSDLVKNAYQLSQIYDKPYYDARAQAGGRLSDLLNSIDLSGGLSKTERNEVGQGLAREDLKRGNANAPSNIDTVANAMRYGQAGYNRQQQAKSNLSAALNNASSFLPAAKSGVDVFQQATGRPSMPNPGAGLYTGITKGGNEGDSMANTLFGGGIQYSNMNNQNYMNQANINAQKKDWMDMLSQITGSVGNIAGIATGLI